MLFWMRRVAANMRGELEAKVDRSLTEGAAWGLSLLAFTAVIREGIETSLFLMAHFPGRVVGRGGAVAVLAGAVVGLLIAGHRLRLLPRGRVLNRHNLPLDGVALIFIAAIC